MEEEDFVSGDDLSGEEDGYEATGNWYRNLKWGDKKFLFEVPDNLAAGVEIMPEDKPTRPSFHKLTLHPETRERNPFVLEAFEMATDDLQRGEWRNNGHRLGVMINAGIQGMEYAREGIDPAAWGIMHTYIPLPTAVLLYGRALDSRIRAHLPMVEGCETIWRADIPPGALLEKEVSATAAVMHLPPGGMPEPDRWVYIDAARNDMRRMLWVTEDGEVLIELLDRAVMRKEWLTVPFLTRLREEVAVEHIKRALFAHARPVIKRQKTT